MEKTNQRKVPSVLMVCLVMGLLVGQSTAIFFEACYAPCLIICTLTTDLMPVCVPKCIATCLFPDFHAQNSQYFCNLGCATTLCSDFSTKADPAAAKVGLCVDSCSNTCAKC